MIPFLNVGVAVTPVAQAKLGDNSLDNVALGSPSASIAAYLEIETPAEIYATFNIVLKSPAVIQVEVEDATAFIPDAEVKVLTSVGKGVLIGKVFAVQARADMHDDGLMADHALFILEEKTYPL